MWDLSLDGHVSKYHPFGHLHLLYAKEQNFKKKKKKKLSMNPCYLLFSQYMHIFISR